MAGGFLKSSAKITLHLKTLHLKTGRPASAACPPPAHRTATAGPRKPLRPASWVCTICSFSNVLPASFDPATANAHTDLTPCQSCGIKPSLSHVLKAAIQNLSKTSQAASHDSRRPDHEFAGGTTSRESTHSSRPSSLANTRECPRCTFANHPSLSACEICGARLQTRHGDDDDHEVTHQSYYEGNLALEEHLFQSGTVRLAFRNGGEKVFYARLKEALTQRKWLLTAAPPIPKYYPYLPSSPSPLHPSSSSNTITGSNGPQTASPPETDSSSAGGCGTPPGSAAAAPKKAAAGIAALEERGLHLRATNAMMIGSAFEDLETLMASAKEIVALAEQFSRQVHGPSLSSTTAHTLADSVNQLSLLAATKDTVGKGSSSSSAASASQVHVHGNSSSGGGGGGGNHNSASREASLYHAELARTLVEFLTDDRRNVLRENGGIITLIDLWALFNRARGGVELVSPADFLRAAQTWDVLGLPVQLRTISHGGLLVAQARDQTESQTVKMILGWLEALHHVPPDPDADASGVGGPLEDRDHGTLRSDGLWDRPDGLMRTQRIVTWDWHAFGRGVTAVEAAEQFGWSLGIAEEELLVAEARGVLCREEGLEGRTFWKNYLVVD